MRDMMATHERLDARTHEPREAVRKAAAAAFEALPALLLAAALLMPAIAALATDEANPEVPVQLGQVIAAQGNEALATIRADARESARASIVLPKLP
jgi:hypothetical protein